MTHPDGTAPAHHIRPWLPPLAIVLLALAASLSGITNQFAQDDQPLIWKNDLVHDLSHGFRFFAEPYWPKPFTPDLYRPLALLSFAIQWVVGGGDPMVFRIVSYLIYAAGSLAVFRLARLTLPFAAAFAAAALFAVHPVHVEAVAVAVNQGELWVSLLLCLAVYQYVRARRTGGPIPARTALGIGALYLVACFFKETALVLPGLLVGAELLLVAGRIPLRTRAREVGRLLLLLAVLAAAFLAVRTSVLDDLRGTALAEAIKHLSLGERAMTMLAVVPHWFRLLFWPAHLQADYNPQEIVSLTTWGSASTVGLMILLAVAATAWVARRRAPVISFGLLWCAIALFPVHNVLVPTGIVLAERTLLLPSVGIVIALGGLGMLLVERAEPSGRKGLAVLVGMLLILGVYKSTTRHSVWSDQFNLWYVTATEDAPLSFSAHHALAELYVTAKADGRAEKEYRLAIALAPPRQATIFLEYANRLRLKGFCYPAVDLYRRSLAVDPNLLSVRASLTACLINLGRYQEALAETAIGLASLQQVGVWRWLQNTADSALRVSAPPGSIRPTAVVDTLSGNVRVGGTR
jgi:protein O-mannosyl-transferase